MLEISRSQALAYRAHVQGLDRRTDSMDELSVLDLGIQAPSGSAVAAALGARLNQVPDPEGDAPWGVDHLTVWSFRGAPHLHRRADLPGLATALWPVGERDAWTRLTSERKALGEAGIAGLDAFTAVAEAEREATAAGPIGRGDLSGQVTRSLPAAYRYFCRVCGTEHVYGNVFQLVGIFAGFSLVPGTTPAVVTPIENRWPVPEHAEGTAEVVTAYLRLHGPATLAEAAGFLGTSATALREVWPEDTVPVRVDTEGRKRWLPTASEALLSEVEVPRPGTLRLLPPLDPWLQGRDREFLVPSTEHRKAVWRMLGNPGVAWLDGEVVGTWRAKTTARRLDLTVTAFQELPRDALRDEAERLASARGREELRVTLA
ncbi:winged helix DNA-binding domain-containing protein [Spiractinospora alimapuensis]|uniref:DNA glycosylase AlkZ-like family protein n=1 Tax=Spiractinospora alimapuensis TaxID=2820884 RepID=UPI001F1B9105|nr:crosslink repair DNA glycosylase YcaQ family protein [Spiractinospora alimapuensis]QVQ50213.1 winged helix DNA-binding domain-containing protein [Spiractinospora alimapuensis]